MAYNMYGITGFDRLAKGVRERMKKCTIVLLLVALCIGTVGCTQNAEETDPVHTEDTTVQETTPETTETEDTVDMTEETEPEEQEETIELTEQITNEYFGLTLSVPEYWNEIAVIVAEPEREVQEDPTKTRVLVFTLFEMLAYEKYDGGGGTVWYLQAYPIEYAHAYDIENVMTVNGRFVIGTDENYRYLLGFPNGVEFLMDNSDPNAMTDSRKQYDKLREDSVIVLENFLEENGITENPDCLIKDLKFLQ